MRNIVLLFISMMLLACQDDRPNVLSVMSHEVNFELQAGLNSFETHFLNFQAVPTNRSDFFENISFSDIGSIRARQGKLVIRGSGFNLQNIESVEVHLASPNDPNRFLELFYTLDLRPNNRRDQEIQLIGSLSDVKDIYIDSEMIVQIRLNFFQVTTENIPVRLEFQTEAIE